MASKVLVALFCWSLIPPSSSKAVVPEVTHNGTGSRSWSLARAPTSVPLDPSSVAVRSVVYGLSNIMAHGVIPDVDGLATIAMHGRRERDDEAHAKNTPKTVGVDSGSGYRHAFSSRLRGRRDNSATAEGVAQMGDSPGDEGDSIGAIFMAADWAWHLVLQARKGGPHEKRDSYDFTKHSERWNSSREVMSQKSRFPAAASGIVGSAPLLEWCFLAIVLTVLLTVDVTVLQALPETERTHVAMLLFWVFMAVIFALEIWLCLSLPAATEWVIGYTMEVVFSVDNVFFALLIFGTLEVPRRLLAKAMFVGLVGSIMFRFVLMLGVASTLDSLCLLPYMIGPIFMYCGFHTLVAFRFQGDDSWSDVTQTAVVRCFRQILGGRLCEFYDEDGEAMFVVKTGKVCITLLGVVVSCVLLSDFVLGLDVVLAKAEALPNAYLNFSSSAVALFTIRALFFVAMDFFHRWDLTRHGVAIVLMFVGCELCLGRFFYVTAASSFVAVVGIVCFAVLASTFMPPSVNKLIA
mmetsp:Transcript_18644/g.51125  ORF Transcript_18644/g.51125 Transcript_18644/m.51125 type:complete len:520 (-) Transcript_18644:47-1606(-)